ncbi:hypothetical protein TIFTF001_025445 [Ficus carica]|uniref:Uncharacterized protein n=1 Tax=Ficus carica TaxID=3494 RepID=A0AA88AR44_FICCA|nr:hypothetical protein TIFTF001_025445 [Ficus carica]
MEGWGEGGFPSLRSERSLGERLSCKGTGSWGKLDARWGEEGQGFVAVPRGTESPASWRADLEWEAGGASSVSGGGLGRRRRVF